METGNVLTTTKEKPLLKPWTELKNRLEDQLAVIQKEESTVLKRAARSLQFATDCYRQLHGIIEQYTFQEREEVFFYKHVKPLFISRIVLNSRLLTIEKNRPPATHAGLQRYYTDELEKLSSIYENHGFIQQYFESGSTYLDDKLFFRPGPDTTIALIGLEPPPDGSFHVCYDYAVGELLAADILKEHLLEVLDDLVFPGHSTGNAPRLTWTAPRVHLVELAYTLKAAGVFNNGKASLKDIVECLEIAFHNKMGNYARSMQEILYRHSGYTVFLDTAKNAFLLFIQNIEDRHVA
ncbi:RteC domain-containing protein [Puia dinghuensis]|uniref:Tetracycline regulation of excision, RteC n=1 Tax=Puia dinghuensis TaxID=1792502 RepID=A0A8J2UBQ9_9BACT|nr:RteC domain-containing protein [Puia dinghuensis]GGA93019.1 hypothetical protein GCM10011511_15530 [Puia dinghuensis]